MSRPQCYGTSSPGVRMLSHEPRALLTNGGLWGQGVAKLPPITYEFTEHSHKPFSYPVLSTSGFLKVLRVGFMEHPQCTLATPVFRPRTNVLTFSMKR